MSEKDLTIGQLALQTGCKVQTIRYYEQIALMPEAARTAGTSDATIDGTSSGWRSSDTVGSWDFRWMPSASY